jgi:hypothetical protein
MKYLLLTVLFVVGCSSRKKPCDLEPKTKLLTTVNGCRVYDVDVNTIYRADSRDICWPRNFMMTDCRETTLKWQCGKSCSTENHNQ